MAALKFKYYLFSLSNFLAAFGGGMVLGKGASIINISWLQGGSILAFLIGSVFGLGFLQLLPKHFAKVCSPYFSIIGAAVSILLLLIWKNFAIDNLLSNYAGLGFFFLLALRFSFWFYSRVLRASNAAGQQQAIAWVELGYYIGMVGGLLLWQIIGIELSLSYVLIIDAIVQCLVCVLDLAANSTPYIKESKESHENIQPDAAACNNAYSKQLILRCWRLAAAVVLLTVNVQVIIFYLAHKVDSTFQSGILATFYLGVAIAAACARKWEVYLDWIPVTNKNSKAHVRMQIFSAKRIFLRLTYLISLLLASVVCISYAILQWQWGTIHAESMYVINSLSYLNILLFVLVAFTAFIFELLLLAIIDRIGIEEKRFDSSNMVIRTYGLMAISAAVFLWVFGLTSSTLTTLLCIATIGAILTIYAMNHRIEASIGRSK